jgi:pimeloyl-ACP methyl ester carboxylesterase
MDEVSYRLHEEKLWEAEGNMVPKEHRIELTHASCTVRVLEIGEGPPVLFIPGAPNAGATWATLVKHLGGLRCLILDRPGTGLSEPLPHVPSPHDLLELGDTLVGDVLDGLHIPRAHIVASSLGGFFALRSAFKSPDRIQRMVQMGCPAFAQGMKEPMFMRLLSLGIVRWLLNRLQPNVKASKNILRQVGHGESIDADKIPAHFFDWYVALQKYTDTMKNDGALIGNIGTFFGGFSPILTIPDDLLRSVRVPTLFYCGRGEEALGGGEPIVGPMVATMPDAELQMVPHAGHLPWLDVPQASAQAVFEFLGRVCPRPAMNKATSYRGSIVS